MLYELWNFERAIWPIVDWFVYLYFIPKTFGHFFTWCRCAANLHTSTGEGKGLWFLITLIWNHELMFAIFIHWTLDLTAVSYQSFASMQREWVFQYQHHFELYTNCGSPKQNMYKAWNKISLSFSLLFLFPPHSVP